MVSISQLVVAGVTGVLIHNSMFIHGEWHLYGTLLLELPAVTYFSLILFEAIYHKIPWLAAWIVSSEMFGMYIRCIFTSISIYRAFFHRLRNVPGPVLASVSKHWHVAHCLDSKSHILIEKLHLEYGDFVRNGKTRKVRLYLPGKSDIGPSDVTIFTPNVIPTMFEGLNNGLTRPACSARVKL